MACLSCCALSYLKLKLRVCLCVYSLIAWERIHRFAPNLAWLFLETKKRFWEGQNSEKLSWVPVPVRAVPVARKLSTIEERRQDQSCLFRSGNYKNKGHNPENCPGFESRWECFCSLETKHDRRMAPRQKNVCFGEEITGTKVTNPKFVLVKVLGLGICFPMLFSDTYRLIRPLESFRAIKIDKKCKHLLNFPQ
jgi:hypothetical protein